MKAEDCPHCNNKVGDGYYDLPCPIHDKQNELSKEERSKAIKRLLKQADKLNW